MEDSAESERFASFELLQNKLFSAVSRGRSPEASHYTKLEEVKNTRKTYSKLHMPLVTFPTPKFSQIW